MPKPVFTWSPDEGSSEEIEPNVSVVKFGDGYEQRIANGINSENVAWSVTFTGDSLRVLPIRNFLRARGAIESFVWTNPLSEVGVYVCRSHRMEKVSASIYKISAKFERVYESAT